MQGMEISGTYPTLYAVFDEAGGLRRKTVARQIGTSIAPRRLGIAPSAVPAPSDIATPLGESWARRFAAELGPLPA